MTTFIVINIILSAVVFAIVVGLIARTIRISSTLPEHRLGRLRSPREHAREQAPARRKPAYRSVSSQA